MRHRKHNHLLGVKTAHRTSLLANLSCSLIENGRIKTTLAKARALRPTIEEAITLAKKAHVASDAAPKVHYRRLAIARLRNKKAVTKLFDELVEQFVNRNGGYTRIYKLAMPRLGDAADMAIIEFVEEATKKKSKKKKSAPKKKTADSKKEPEKENVEQAEEKTEPEDESASEDPVAIVDEVASDVESEQSGESETETTEVAENIVSDDQEEAVEADEADTDDQEEADEADTNDPVIEEESQAENASGEETESDAEEDDKSSKD